MSTRLGNAIAQRRKELGLTQTALAAKAKLPVGTLACIESKSRRVKRPTDKTLQCLAEALGLQMADLKQHITFKKRSLLGEHVLKLRKERQWTQQQLATEANLSKQTVYKIERGEIHIRRSTLDCLAKAFLVPLATFQVLHWASSDT